jgi:hypothetical protein
MTIMAIKHCVQRQKNGSENTMGRELQQQQFWLSRCHGPLLLQTTKMKQPQYEKIVS